MARCTMERVSSWVVPVYSSTYEVRQYPLRGIPSGTYRVTNTGEEIGGNQIRFLGTICLEEKLGTGY